MLKDLILFFVFISLCFSCTSLSNNTTNVNIIVLNYGLYEAEIIDEVDASDAITGSIYKYKNVKLIDSSEEIKIQKNKILGLKLIYDNPSVPKIFLKYKFIFPEIKDPVTQKVTTVSSHDGVMFSSKERFIGYIFEEEYEMVKGEWSIEVYMKDRLLVSKSFTLY